MQCNGCNTYLGDIDGIVRLDGRAPFLHCPLCGIRLGPFEAAGIYYDSEAGAYFGWSLSAEQSKTFQVGKLQIEIALKPASLADCLFSRMVFFKRKSGDADPPHYSPIRPDRAHLIKTCVLHTFGALHRTYRLTTRDGFSATVSVAGIEIVDLPDAPDAQGTALYAWPNFHVRGWNKYYIGFFPPTIAASYGSGEIHEVWGRRDGDPKSPLIRASIAHHYCQVDFVPESVVLVWKIDNDRYYARYDTRNAESVHLDQPAWRSYPTLTLGFDFGTTNTAASAFAIPELDGREGNVDMPLPINDRTLRLIDGHISAENTWLPQPPPGKTLSFIPSQLYFFEADYLPLVSPNDQPVKHFTIPFFQDRLPEDRCVAGFKWAVNLKQHQEKAPALRYAFCRLALEMYLAELVSAYGVLPSPIILVATYPLAFNVRDQAIHTAVFDDLRQKLDEATGFRISLSRPLDESHAAEECGESITGAEVILYLDVGGGTTDVCISQWNDQTRAVSIVDSIEYGGEDVNAAIEGLTTLTPAQLRQQIRMGGAKVYREPAYFAGNFQRVELVENSIERFRRGLVEIGARFVAAECVNNPAATTRIGLMMFGSGWKTIFQTDDHHTMEREAAAAIGERLKEFQRIGILTAVPTVLCKYPADPKGVVAKGAARVGGKKLLIDQRSTGTYILEDLRVITGNTEKSFVWSQRTPIKFEVMPGKVLLANTARFQFERATLVENGRTKLLEEQDFSACVRGSDIASSPFAIYVSNHYRAELNATRKT